MANDLSFCRHIARFAASLPVIGRDSEEREVLLGCVVDAVACMVGARNARAVRLAREVATGFSRVERGGSVPCATLVGSDAAATIEAAAFVNALAVRCLDFNDIYLSKEAVHPSDNTALALVLAEALEIDGGRFLDALAKSYEVHCRLADTVSTRAGGWDHSLLTGISSAVAAGVLMGLTEEQLADAVAIAATANVALMETRVGELSMWKGAASPYASKAGLFAALHARGGMTGPSSALEGRHGLFKQVTGAADPQAFHEGNGRFRLLGVHMKPHPIGYFTQPAIQCALAMRDSIRVDDIIAVNVTTVEFARLATADGRKKWEPSNRETADHSLPYGVAIALLEGDVTNAQFNRRRYLDDDVRALMAKVCVQVDATLEEGFPEKVAARVTIVHDRDRSDSRAIDCPRGHPNNRMSRAEVGAKLVAAFAGVGSPDRLLEDLWRLDGLSGPRFSRLIRQIVALPADSGGPAEQEQGPRA